MLLSMYRLLNLSLLLRQSMLTVPSSFMNSEGCRILPCSGTRAPLKARLGHEGFWTTVRLKILHLEGNCPCSLPGPPIVLRVLDMDSPRGLCIIKRPLKRQKQLHVHPSGSPLEPRTPLRTK